MRSHLIELVVVFVGVALAFAVENFREDLSNRSVEAQYLRGFRQDLLEDAEMLRAEREARQAQMDNALAVLEFFEGRPADPQAFFEDHVARDFDEYLYNTTFSSIPVQFYGPWEDTPANRRALEVLLGNLTVENGFRLVVANLEYEKGGLLKNLETAQSQVESLLQIIPAD